MKIKRGYYDVFVDACAKYSSAIAMRHYENGVYKTYTYSELYGVCEYLSQNLLQLKCNKGIIGLISERNVIIPCLIAASHKFCSSFMFINPTQNVESVANNIIFTAIITITKTDDNSGMQTFFGKNADKTVSVFDLNIKFFTFETKCMNSSKSPVPHSYIATTSGSTGEPKHIQVPIQCLQPNIKDLTKIFNITSSDIIYFSTPLTFDPSMVEILLACLNGASLLIAPEKIDVLFPDNKLHSISFWQTTPSRFLQHSNADIKNKVLSKDSSLKVLALGGEPLNNIKRLRELKCRENNTKIYTLYGVTEMSCWACAAELNLDRILADKEVPLGNCLSETEIIVKPIEENPSVGNIVLMSKSRNCCIINKSNGMIEQKSLRFVDTGDLGEVKNGTIYYRGRRDDVIKRFGHKINLQMIEFTIMQCPRVKTCSCIWLPKPMLLVVYFSSESLSTEELSNFLKCKLEDKYWPDKVIRVDTLPTNPHGKLSKLLLSKMYEQYENVPVNIETLKTNLLKELNGIMSTKLTFEDIKDKDFQSIGGTSFLAVTLCNKLSTIHPLFGSVLLPYLMTENSKFSEIFKLAEKELGIEKNKRKRRAKRSQLTSRSPESDVSKKTSPSILFHTVEFIVIWTFNTGKCVDASPTLFQCGFNLFVTVGSHSGNVVVLDAITGLLRGCIRVDSRVEASALCYTAPSPRAVVGTYDGTIVCYSLENCEVFWKVNIGSMVKSKPVCCKGVVYVAAYDGKVRYLDITTGELKGTINVVEQAISADLVLAKDEFVIVGTLSGVCGSIYVSSNTLAWRGSVASPIFARPLLYDEDKYVVFAEVNGEINCRTVEKGIKIWRYQGAKGNIFSSIYAKELDSLKWQMVFGCHDNSVYSIIIKNFVPSLHWKTALTSPVYSTPCGLGDKLIVAISNDGNLNLLDDVNGKIMDCYKLPNEVFSSPSVYGDYIFVGCRNDHVFALKYVLKK